MEKIIQNKFVELLKTDIKNDIVFGLMEKFDNEIVIYEDEDDPMRPSVCREEFKLFLEETIENSIKIEGNSIKFGVGDEGKLGIGEKLDEETTDCLNFLLVRSDFDERSRMFGWEQRPDWRFSNFPGVNLFDDIELDMDKYIKKVIEGLK